MVWQTTFTLPSSSKGCYLVTKDVERACAEGLRGVKAGIISLTIQHTSAALSLNENFDSTGARLGTGRAGVARAMFCGISLTAPELRFQFHLHPSNPKPQSAQT